MHIDEANDSFIMVYQKAFKSAKKHVWKISLKCTFLRKYKMCLYHNLGMMYVFLSSRFEIYIPQTSSVQIFKAYAN